jgi:hypothetical protein
MIETLEPFRSNVVPLVGIKTSLLEHLVQGIYARGLSTRDIEDLFRDDQGERPLSRGAGSEMTEAPWKEYRTFCERRTKIIPCSFDEKSLFKLVFATLIRVSQRWQRIGMTSFELAQVDKLRRSWECVASLEGGETLSVQGKSSRGCLESLPKEDILPFPQRRSLIVAHPGDSKFEHALPQRERSLMVIHFYRENKT